MPVDVASDLATIAGIATIPKILRAVANTTGMRFAVVARVTDTSWTACAVYDQINFGLQPGGELVLESTLCNEIRQHRRPIVFEQATADPLYARHPTPKMYGFESYISIPIIRANGEFFGTLCALDPLPAKLDDPRVVPSLELFADLIAAELDREALLVESRDALNEANVVAKWREHFIAVLGHDLRNPLHAIAMGADVLAQSLDDKKSLSIVGSVKRSVARMSELIENILDFARGRMSGGMPVTITLDKRLGEQLQHVVDEVAGCNPGCIVETSLSIDGPVACDSRRIAQMLGNLLSNAVVHGSAERPVRVVAKTTDDHFELSVTNAGKPIASDILPQLFQPFRRGTPSNQSGGLGLGLHICSEIAKAHHGNLQVTSSQCGETQFVFRMPLTRN